jgi:hypothetical protein
VGGKPCTKKCIVIIVSSLVEGLHDLSWLGKGKVVFLHTMKVCVYWSSGGVGPHVWTLDGPFPSSLFNVYFEWMYTVLKNGMCSSTRRIYFLLLRCPLKKMEV